MSNRTPRRKTTREPDVAEIAFSVISRATGMRRKTRRRKRKAKASR